MAWPIWFTELVVVALGADLARLNQDETLAYNLRVEAFGTPSADGDGGLFAAARIEDARNAPTRQLFYDDDPGRLVAARFSWSPWGGC